jgi:hypothetical protein
MGRKKGKGRRSPGSGPGSSGFGFLDSLFDQRPRAVLDLHGDTALEAERRVRDFVVAQARLEPGAVVHIITGRGGGGGRRPVLPGAVRKVLGSPDLERFVAEFDRDLDEAGFLVRLR